MDKRLIFAAVILSTAGLAASSAFAQDTAQTAPQQNAQATKKPKVWTDDNIDSVRTPSDVYQMQEKKEKDAQQQAAAAAKQAASQDASTAAPLGPRPKTVQQADSMIAQKKQFLTSEQDVLKQVQAQLNDPNVTGLERTRLEWRLKSHGYTAQSTQSQLTQLEKDREALAKKAQKGSADNSSSSSSSSNQQ